MRQIGKVVLFFFFFEYFIESCISKLTEDFKDKMHTWNTNSAEARTHSALIHLYSVQ